MGEDGTTRRQRNKRFGQAHKNKKIKVPSALRHVWDWWQEIAATRPSGMSGIELLTNHEIMAWIQLTGEPIRREEIQLIKKMDAAFVGELNADAERRRKAKEEAQNE